jgi:hypothetical protein
MNNDFTAMGFNVKILPEREWIPIFAAPTGAGGCDNDPRDRFAYWM